LAQTEKTKKLGRTEDAKAAKEFIGLRFLRGPRATFFGRAIFHFPARFYAAL
jgi:hypothetical protein